MKTPEQIEPLKTPAFYDGLVERLARVGYEAARADIEAHGGRSGRWEFLTDKHKEHELVHTRAILTELASEPCELPTARELGEWLDSDHRGGETLNEAMVRMDERIRARLAPILAAKATCIDNLGRELVQAKARIAELEKTTCELPTPEVIDFFLTGCTFPVPSEKAMTLLKMLRWQVVDAIRKAIDDELAKLAATASITDTTKPTKPLASACVGCGGTGVDLNQHTCFECGGKGHVP